MTICNAYENMNIYIHTYGNISIYICLRLYIYVYITYIYMYYTHTHTHIYIYILRAQKTSHKGDDSCGPKHLVRPTKHPRSPNWHRRVRRTRAHTRNKLRSGLQVAVRRRLALAYHHSVAPDYCNKLLQMVKGDKKWQYGKDNEGRDSKPWRLWRGPWQQDAPRWGWESHHEQAMFPAYDRTPLPSGQRGEAVHSSKQEEARDPEALLVENAPGQPQCCTQGRTESALPHCHEESEDGDVEGMAGQNAQVLPPRARPAREGHCSAGWRAGGGLGPSGGCETQASQCCSSGACTERRDYRARWMATVESSLGARKSPERGLCGGPATSLAGCWGGPQSLADGYQTDAPDIASAVCGPDRRGNWEFRFDRRRAIWGGQNHGTPTRARTPQGPRAPVKPYQVAPPVKTAGPQDHLRDKLEKARETMKAAANSAMHPFGVPRPGSASGPEGSGAENKPSGLVEVIEEGEMRDDGHPTEGLNNLG